MQRRSLLLFLHPAAQIFEIHISQSFHLKPRAKGPNIDRCFVLRPLALLLHFVAYCLELLRKVWNRSNFWTSNFKHFFCSVIAEAWRNNVGFVCTALPTSTHAHYTWFTKSYRLYPSHYALQLPTLLAMHTTANIVGSTMLGVGHAAEDQKQIRTSSWWINHPQEPFSEISPEEVLQSWLIIQSIIY